MTNLLNEPPETLLPPDPAAAVAEQSPDDTARRHPTSSLVWAILAERALDAGHDVQAYAYARTGYHRGLDALRRAGWKGFGPVPWEHEPNRGFLRALAALARAAEAIEETAEQERCEQLLRDSSMTAARTLGLA